MTHQTQITQQIFDVCHDHAITALYAIESGSRAWGFDSMDSDFDVRLIYCHQVDWYLQIYEGRDTFEFIDHALFDVPFDIGGWDIKKALTHLYQSNAVIFEWLNSPIVYHGDERFVKMIKEIYDDFFNPQAVYQHYQGMAKKVNADLDLNYPIKIKKWCYLIRALLASLWIVKYRTIPPVLMSDMFVLLSDDDRHELEAVISLKRQHDESYLLTLPKSLKDLTHHLWTHTQNISFDKKPKGDIGLLNDVFKNIIIG